ncbi:MAG: hypothetical protein R3E79_15330 [Caldilineaceae bacterium]
MATAATAPKLRKQPATVGVWPVLMLWTVTVGSDLKCASTLDNPDLPDFHALLNLKPVRRLRLLRLGRLWLLVNAISQQALHLPHQLLPEPWPAPLSPTQAMLTPFKEAPA